MREAIAIPLGCPVSPVGDEQGAAKNVTIQILPGASDYNERQSRGQYPLGELTVNKDSMCSRARAFLTRRFTELRVEASPASVPGAAAQGAAEA